MAQPRDGSTDARPRPAAEFRAVADDGFAAWTEDAIARCLGVLDGAHVGSDARRHAELDPSPPRPRTAAYAAAHALAHLGEHVGHLHMTRELLVEGTR